ncbi:MAG: hypothetical protein WD052_01915 [Bacteroidales bacterium]
MQIKRRGFIGTVIVHGLVLALLILGGLTFPDPPPEEEGVLVNFGTDDSGFGNVEPIGDDTDQGSSAPDIAENTPERVETVPEPVSSESKPRDNTQDVEEVIVKEDPKPTAEEIRKQQEAIERAKIQKEQQRLQQLEEERIRKEQEAERKRIEEERLRKEQQADRLNNMGRNTFGRQGVGETDGSEGVNPGTGTNQGTNTGSQGATNYNDGSGLGDGPAYSLGSRKVVGQLPLPNVDDCSVTSRIVVTVEIQVDRDGNVVAASVKSATFADNCIWEVVFEAARRTKFSSDANAPIKQTGSIKYTIEP